MTPAPHKRRPLSSFDVRRVPARYWARQPGKLAAIVAMLVAAALIETYLPTALSAFLGAVRQTAGQREVLLRLSVFLGAYVIQAAVFSLSYILYNSFETLLFKAVLDDAFTHIHRLPEQFFANTFTGAIISKINRARTKIETFEDEVILRILPTTVVLAGSLIFLALRFPGLAALMTAYLAVLAAVSAFLVFRVSAPRRALMPRRRTCSARIWRTPWSASPP